MSFFNNLEFAAVNRQLEKSNQIVRDKLSGNGPTDEIREFLGTALNVLASLNHSEAVGPSFGLYWNHKLRALLVDTNINLIDFDLANTSHSCTQMIL